MPQKFYGPVIGVCATFLASILALSFPWIPE